MSGRAVYFARRLADRKIPLCRETDDDDLFYELLAEMRLS